MSGPSEAADSQQDWPLLSERGRGVKQPVGAPVVSLPLLVEVWGRVLGSAAERVCVGEAERGTDPVNQAHDVNLSVRLDHDLGSDAERLGFRSPSRPGHHELAIVVMKGGSAAVLVAFPCQRGRDIAPDLDGRRACAPAKTVLDVAEVSRFEPPGFEDDETWCGCGQIPHGFACYGTEGRRGDAWQGGGHRLLEDVFADHRDVHGGGKVVGQRGLARSGQAVDQDEVVRHARMIPRTAAPDPLSEPGGEFSSEVARNDAPVHRTRRIGLPGLDENFEAIYLDDEGVEQRVPWGWLPEVVDVLDRPTRSGFPGAPG